MMLGKYYSQLEEWLGRAPNGELEREYGHLVHRIDPADYLAELLAELLNRARAMESLIENAAMEQRTSNHIYEAIRHTFLQDCEEVRARAFRAGFLSDNDDAYVTSRVIPTERIDMINLPQLPVPERRCDECGEKFQPEHFGWPYCEQCCDASTARIAELAKQPEPECADPHGERLDELLAKEKRLAELEAAGAGDQGSA